MSTTEESTSALRPLQDREVGDELTQVLATSHLLKSLDGDAHSRVVASGKVARFSAGDLLMREGEPGDTMYVIVHGTVRVEVVTPSGSVQLAELGRGACIGEVAVLTGRPRTATVTALDEVDAFALERAAVEALLEEHPKVRQLLESLVEGRARDTIEKMMAVTPH